MPGILLDPSVAGGSCPALNLAETTAQQPEAGDSAGGRGPATLDLGQGSSSRHSPKPRQLGEMEREGENAEGQQPFIPGLPDELGLLCVLRSSRASIVRSALVSRRWHEAVSDPRFFAWRAEMGVGEEWLCMCVMSKRPGLEDRFDWQCFSPGAQSWIVLPAIPKDNEHGCAKTRGFAATAVDGLGLFIAGGSLEGRGLRHVTVFDFRKGRWGIIHSDAFSARLDPVVASVGKEVFISGGKDVTQSQVVETMITIDAESHVVTSVASCWGRRNDDAPEGPVGRREDDRHGGDRGSVGLEWCETLKFDEKLYAKSRRECLFGAALSDSGFVFAFDSKLREWVRCPSGANAVSKAWKALMAPLGATLYMMDGSLCLWRWIDEKKGGKWAKVGGTLQFGYVLMKLVPCAGRLYAIVYSADCGKHKMLEVRLDSSNQAKLLHMTPIDLPGIGYYSAIVCHRM